jgi:hypothetical protein
MSLRSFRTISLLALLACATVMTAAALERDLNARSSAAGKDPLAGPGAPTADRPVLSSWMAALPAIDGSDAEWSGVTQIDAEDGNIGLAFANDAKNLYILMVIRNPQVKSSIEQTGVTLYFNAQGKKKKDYGILFNKIMIKPDEYIALVEKQGPLTEEQKAQIRSKPGYYLYHHEVLEKVKGDFAQPEGLVQPAVYKYAAKGSQLFYEFLVPLARANPNLAGVGVEPGRPVMVGIEYGGMTDEMRRNRNRQTGGGSIADEQVTGRAAASADQVGGRGGRSGIATGGSTGGSGRSTPQKYTVWNLVQSAQETK